MYCIIALTQHFDVKQNYVGKKEIGGFQGLGIGEDEGVPKRDSTEKISVGE